MESINISDDNFNELIKRFKIINKQRYVKGVNNNNINSCGITFEKLIGKNTDSMFFPDFKDIEIKCKQRFSRYDLNLFTLTFDGPNLFESNYILETYGSNDNMFFNKKELFVNLKYKEKVFVDRKYYFELDSDDEKEMIFVNIYDNDSKLLEKRCFIFYSSIKNRINVKLRKLALIRASKRKIGFNLYFRYYKISCYELKAIDNFIDMIKKGVIKLSIVLRFSKSGFEKGKQKNKNMVFSINQDKIEEIYNKIYEYEN